MKRDKSCWKNHHFPFSALILVNLCEIKHFLLNINGKLLICVFLWVSFEFIRKFLIMLHLCSWSERNKTWWVFAKNIFSFGVKEIIGRVNVVLCGTTLLHIPFYRNGEINCTLIWSHLLVLMSQYFLEWYFQKKLKPSV